MATPVGVVENFFAEFNRGNEGMYAAIREYFQPETLWDNVGLAKTTGVDEALALITQFHEEMAIAAVVVEMLAIAADGNTVFTERIDRLINEQGEELSAPVVVGVFTIDGDSIAEWRDYFDPAAVDEVGIPAAD